MPVCPQCHSPLPDDSPEGLCPACLLQRGLEANTLPGGTEPGAKAAGTPRKGSWTPPTVGELSPFFPDLDVLEFLGRGGMGAVYKARQKSLDRIVALKILPPAIGRDGAFAARFAQEAQAMARLNHPHIVTIFEFGQRQASGPTSGVSGQKDETLEYLGEYSGSPASVRPLPPPLYFFLMEFVDGLSLRQLIDARTIAPKDALAIVPQICEALQYAHDRGIIHRDIKPENVLLTREGQIKIADFGLAELVGSAGMGGAGAAAGGDSPAYTGVAGTPAYMAPEQAAAPAAVDHRADIYALGVVFYQLLTGELPKGGGNLVPPSKKVQIDVRLDEIVLRAIEKSPSLRYQNATQFKTEVETVVAGTAARGAEVATPAAVGGSHVPGRGVLEKDGEVRSRSGRMSRLAIAGALASVIFFAALIVFLVGNWRWASVVAEISRGRGPHLDMNEWMWLRPMVYVVWALAPVAFLGTTLAGIISVIRIRKSKGKLVGLPLALYDLLVFPLLGLDAVIWLVVYGIVQYVVAFQNVRAEFGRGPQINVGVVVVWLGAIVLSSIVDTAIVWIAWLIVRPAKKGPAPIDRAAPAPTPGNKGSKPPFAYKPALITAVAHVCLLVLFVGFFAYVVPRQVENFRGWQAALPMLTQWTIGFGRLVQQWACFLGLPVLVAVGGLPFAAEYVGGRVLRRVYSVFYTGIVLLLLLGAGLSLKLPVNARATVSTLDSGYLCEVVTDSLLAEGYGADYVKLRYSNQEIVGLDLPGLCRLQGQTCAEGTVPVAGSLAVKNFRAGVWEVTGRDGLSEFHIIVHTPADRGMGPTPTLPMPPTQVAGVLAEVRHVQTSDPARAAALLRQAQTMIWLNQGDSKDIAEVKNLAREMGVMLPEGVPLEEDLRALGSQRLDAGGSLQREVSVGEPVYFDYRLGGELAVVQVRVTPNVGTNALVCVYHRQTANSSGGTVLPQTPISPRPMEGTWSVEFRDMDHWAISATRVAPGRFLIRVMPMSPASKTAIEALSVPRP